MWQLLNQRVAQVFEMFPSSVLTLILDFRLNSRVATALTARNKLISNQISSLWKPRETCLIYETAGLVSIEAHNASQTLKKYLLPFYFLPTLVHLLSWRPGHGESLLTVRQKQRSALLIVSCGCGRQQKREITRSWATFDSFKKMRTDDNNVMRCV